MQQIHKFEGLIPDFNYWFSKLSRCNNAFKKRITFQFHGSRVPFLNWRLSWPKRVFNLHYNFYKFPLKNAKHKLIGKTQNMRKFTLQWQQITCFAILTVAVMFYKIGEDAHSSSSLIIVQAWSAERKRKIDCVQLALSSTLILFYFFFILHVGFLTVDGEGI